MSIETLYTWKCERCGEKESSDDKEQMVKLSQEHSCNPALYDWIRSLRTEFINEKHVCNCNGGSTDVANLLGISNNLAGKILNEMEKLGLASPPYRI